VGDVPTASVHCSIFAAPAEADSALFDAGHPGVSPQPVLTRPRLVAAIPALANSPMASSGQSSTLFGDPEDARYVYQVHRRKLSMIDAATWAVRWTTAVPVPRAFGASGQDDLIPRFFRGYTEIVAGGPSYYVDGPPPAAMPDQVVTAVDARGRLLQSCTIRPAVQNPVMLPHAGILLLPGRPSRLGPGVTAYSTATGIRLWHAPGGLSVTTADTVYVNTSNPKPGVAAYDAVSGRRLWSDQPRGRALTAIAVINGIVYAQRSAATMNHMGAVLALRASDGRQLWHRPRTPPDGTDGPQIVGVDAGSVLFLPIPGDTDPEAGMARLINVINGRLLASASIYKIGRNDPWRTWQTWPAMLSDHHAIVVASDYDRAFTLTAARGYPSNVSAGVGEYPAAVARNVAYFISGESCPSDSTEVTALDLRTGKLLWTVELPHADVSHAASLLAYDNGFAVRLSDGRLLRYR
jgi:outer membrane protein assembly factor BamB